MKNKSFTIILSTLFIGIIGINICKADVQYTDTGLVINNKKIWILKNLEAEKNICIENERREKECILKTDICMYKCENMLFPIDGKGIFYMKDEFNLNYYDLTSKKDVQIVNGIYKLFGKYEIDKSAVNFMDDRYFKPFTDANLSPDKNKLAIEIVFNNPIPPMEVLTPMICIIDINKLSKGKDDYIGCPIITDKMENLDIQKVPWNTWESDELPIWKGWATNDAINIKTKNEETFAIDIKNSFPKKGSGNTIIATIVILFSGIAILSVLHNKKSKN